MGNDTSTLQNEEPSAGGASGMEPPSAVTPTAAGNSRNAAASETGGRPQLIMNQNQGGGGSGGGSFAQRPGRALVSMFRNSNSNNSGVKNSFSLSPPSGGGAAALTENGNGKHHLPGVYNPQQQQPYSSMPSPTPSSQQAQAYQYQNQNQVLTPEQQQYYQQQQQQFYMQQQQQQQQQAQMHPPQHAAYHSAQAAAQQQYYQNPPSQEQYSYPPQQGATVQVPDQHPVVGVMYASEGGRSKKRNSGRGAISASNRMAAAAGDVARQLQNMSLGSVAAKQPANLKTTGLAGPTSAEENDWETRWDEDDESSGEEEEIDGPSTSAGIHYSVPHQFRPAMDVGHSSGLLGLPPRPVVDSQMKGAPVKDAPPAGAAPLSYPQAETVPQTTPVVVSSSDGGKVHPRRSNSAPVGAPAPKVQERPNVKMFFPLLRVLGKGSFGKVVLVQKRTGKEKGMLFAMKILKKTHLVKRKQIERTKTERKVLSIVDHPFIMKLHFAFQTEDKLYLVLDYCPGGELFFHLSRFRRFPERVARFYAAELLLAIGHIHKRGIIYRDLKPENVLLDADGHVKLGDFGLAKDCIKHPCEGATSMCGTPEYMAPEVLSQAGHGFCVDYWGLGMLVYEMMTGLPPWYTTDRAKLFKRLKSAPLEIPSYFSAQSAQFVSTLLERNPRRRLGVLGIKTVMEQEYFRSMNWRALYARRIEAPIRPCEAWKPPSDDYDPSGPKSNTPSRRNSGNTPSLHGIESDGTGNLTISKINQDNLDAVTGNFDSSFLRMPIETEDGANDGQESDDGNGEEQLHEDTFLGFSFDEQDIEAAKRIYSHPKGG